MGKYDLNNKYLYFKPLESGSASNKSYLYRATNILLKQYNEVQCFLCLNNGILILKSFFMR
jgi:hypothetical protein